MMRGVFVLVVYMAFLAFGWAGVPFAASLGYVWVDSFMPQLVAPEYMNLFPVSLTMALSAVGSYLVLDRAYFRMSTVSILILVFVFWITLSTFTWAVVPFYSTQKWDYAWKAVAFAVFLPLVFRSQLQIEAFLLTWIFSTGVHILPFGLKTMVSGGGYGQSLGVFSGNSLLTEGSTLSAVALCQIPLLLHFANHSMLIPDRSYFRWPLRLYSIVCIAGAIGTYERTALVCLVVVGFTMWLRAKRKVFFGIVCGLAAVLIGYFAAGAWSERISTTADYASEGSALGRILAWQWTLDYVGDHPLGGGFDVYRINRIVFPPNPVTGVVETFDGKAFHSSWFEVLGEQGWPGLIIFLLILALCFLQMQSSAKRAKGVPGFEWVRSLAQALQSSLLTLCAGASFVGIAFQPMLWYLVVGAIATHNYLSLIDRATVDANVARRRSERMGFRAGPVPRRSRAVVAKVRA